MKTFLGNISAQKKNHLEICLGTATWLWFWINGLISSSFSTYIFPDIKRNGIWLCFKWFVLFGAKDYEQTVRHFFLSEITEKLMQNKLTNETLFTSKYLTLSLEKKCSLAAVESLCSVCYGRWLYFQDRPEKKVILHFWYS